MSDILNASNQKMGSIGEDNKVRNVQGIAIGSVLNNGDVYNMQKKIGTFDGKGYVYEGPNHIGTVHPDGTVHDSEDHYIGKIVGGHIESGGAALLLLLR